MANGLAPVAVSLRPMKMEDDDASNDLLSKIRLINQQRDGFRNVTEEQLQLEMSQIRDGDLSESESEEDEGEDEKSGTMESILPKRQQMDLSLRTARDNGLFALDSLSLASSANLPTGFQTASPAIKQSVPVAALKYMRRHAQPPSNDPERERKKTQLWSGSFMTNNTDAADTLLAAATRLEDLVKAETEYWGQLLSLTSNGWPVYKPGPQEAMHVNFVATEASPQFKMQGVARLNPDKDGTVKLGKGVGSEPRTLRLRLQRNGEVVASSVTASLLSLADLGSSLEDKVRREQSSLFEEELFQEMTLEARTLQPLGVKLRDKVLHLPVPGSEAIKEEYLIDLVPVDEASDMISTSNDKYKDLLDAQSVLLRLLLCHIYHLRLEKRSKPPEPLSESTKKPAPSKIIRSFMAMMQHHNACRPLSAYLNTLSRVLANAGLAITCPPLSVPGLHEILQITTKAGKKSSVHQLLAKVMEPQKTTILLRFMEKTQDKSPAEHVATISVHTDLSPPTFGSEYVVELTPALAKLKYGHESHNKQVAFSDCADLSQYLSHLMSMQVTRQWLLPGKSGWDPAPDMPIMQKLIGKNGQQQKIAVGVKVESELVELRIRRIGGQNNQDRELWTSTALRQDGKTLSAVFGAWTEES